jgi:hypothetical protein
MAKLDITLTKVSSDLHKTKERCTLSVGPAWVDGRRSHLFNVDLSDGGDVTIVNFDLNKNHARYLFRALQAFCEEKDIDPSDED